MSETTFYGTGRRKRSVARVYLSPGKGNIKVNGESFRDYLCRDSLATIVMQPLVAVEGEKAFDIEICLLYTSPSPRDLRLSRMPSSA